MARNGESIGTFISLGVLVVESRGGVERLVQVSDVMDEETEGVRSSSIVVTGVESVLDIIVHVGLLVALAVLA